MENRKLTMSEKARIGRWVREHGLPPSYMGHFCKECRKYDIDEKNCHKWMKKYDGDKKACMYFSKGKKIKGEAIIVNWEGNPLLRSKRIYIHRQLNKQITEKHENELIQNIILQSKLRFKKRKINYKHTRDGWKYKL